MDFAKQVLVEAEREWEERRADVSNLTEAQRRMAHAVFKLGFVSGVEFMQDRHAEWLNRQIPPTTGTN